MENVKTILENEAEGLLKKYEAMTEALEDNTLADKIGIEYYHLLEDSVCALRLYINTLMARIDYLDAEEERPEVADDTEEKVSDKEPSKEDVLKFAEAITALLSTFIPEGETKGKIKIIKIK